MTEHPPTNWSVFRDLCRVMGGRDEGALKDSIDAGQLQLLCEMAHSQDLLPALAVRCNEQALEEQVLGNDVAEVLNRALLDNTKRNMQICAQAIKLTRQLNLAGIRPLFLKGTALLLTSAHHNLGFRKQVDIDLIVRPDELEAAGDALLAAGYHFCRVEDETRLLPLEPGDTASALRFSAAHHHLPPLVSEKYTATVELHRHYLPGRFQRGNPLGSLFDSARQIEQHGVTFCVPSTEFQFVHLTLGKFVYDGYQARRTFPIREACDLISLLENAGTEIDEQLIAQHCRRPAALLFALVAELMAYRPRIALAGAVDASGYVQLMRKRYESPRTGALLDAYARAGHLALALVYSPAKLPAYVGRLIPFGRG